MATPIGPAKKAPVAGFKAGAGRTQQKVPQRQYSAVELGSYLVGSVLWVSTPEREEKYVKANVKSIEGNQVVVEYDGATHTVGVEKCLNANVGIDPVTVVDLAKLPHANEAAAIEILRARYLADQIYTYAGRLLVAMNPFKLIPGLYEAKTITRYQNADTSRGFPTEVPPHTYAVAQSAMDALRLTCENQSCIVSGESGSGKTETARQLMQYFASSKTGSGGNRIQEIILGANPLLEALGNAKTLRNNNSSRFGRFVKLDVAPAGGVHGGIISNYMLELSRIEFQAKEERNYHIFYQMLKGLSEAELLQCSFLKMENYEFLNKSGCYEVDTVNDTQEFQEVRQQLRLLYKPDEELAYFKCLSAVLLAGNVKFKNVTALGTDKAAQLESENTFNTLASLLGVNTAAFQEALTLNVVEVRGNIIKSPLSAEQATVLVRSMAKEVYSVLFDYIVQCINKNIEFDDEGKPWIGILDIYGFEFFQNNSYEQFLINYANERLQQLFIQQVFQAEKVEYAAENIDHSMIVYSDNASVLEVFDKPKAGIFAFLEEQCLIQTGTSESFTTACHKYINNSNFITPKGDSRLSFIVVHTAAPVTYDTSQFVPKNKMRLSNELLLVFKAATNVCMRGAFAPCEVPDTKNMKGRFVGSKFQRSMSGLTITLKASHAHFSRCIKPNQVKKPQIFETEGTLNQMISLSILEAVGIIHKGFAYRATFEDFLEDNNVLMRILGAKMDGGDSKTACVAMLNKLNVPNSEYQLGNTKLFLRKAGWLMVDKYFRTVLSNLKPLIVKLQSIYRAHKARVTYERFSRRIIRLQALMRRYAQRISSIQKNYILRMFAGAVASVQVLQFENILIAAATQIQSVWRGHLTRKKMKKQISQLRARKQLKQLVLLGAAGVSARRWKRFSATRKQERAATKLQSHWRCYKAKKLLRQLRLEAKQNAAATTIQKVIRGAFARLRVKLMRQLTPIAVTIQKYWRGYRVRTSATYKRGAVVFDKVRRQLREDRGRVLLQSVMRRFLILSRLQNLTQAAYSMQMFAQPKLLRLHFEKVMNATVKLQAWWRGNRIRRMMQEEKLKLVLGRHLREAKGETFQECYQAALLLRSRRRRNLANKGWQLIHVNVGIQRDDVYPKGWAAGIGMVFRFNPEAVITHIAAGAFHTVVATSTGFVYSFGLNDRGQLGMQQLAGVGGLPLPQVPLLGMQTPVHVKELCCGVDHALLLDMHGRVFAWGSNQFGQCGCAPGFDKIYTPMAVHFRHVRSRRRSGSRISYKLIRTISAGAYHNAALDQKGRLFMWGRGDHIFIEGVFSDVPLPLWITHASVLAVPRLHKVTCGLGFTYLLSSNGTLYVFGKATTGQLGLDSASRSINAAAAVQNIYQKIVSVSCGIYSTLAVTSSGDVLQWGLFLLWDPVEQVCIKAQSFVPMIVDLKGAGARGVAVDAEAGWWEGVAVTSGGLVWAWNFFEQPEKGILRPALYQYLLADGQCVRAVKMLASPLLSATLVEFTDTCERQSCLSRPPSTLRKSAHHCRSAEVDAIIPDHNSRGIQ